MTADAKPVVIEYEIYLNYFVALRRVGNKYDIAMDSVGGALKRVSLPLDTLEQAHEAFDLLVREIHDQNEPRDYEFDAE